MGVKSGRWTLHILLQGATALALAGCSSNAPTENAAGGADGPAGRTSEAPVGNRTAAAPAPSGPLAVYVGKYPFDKVAGTSFLDDPLVRKSVRAAVGDPTILAWIFDKAGPQTPIAMIDGRLAAWGCEAHNCGPHQWTVLIAPDGSDAELCYLPDDAVRPVWYADGGATKRDASCPPLKG
ncbi:hypothetical protein [Sphingomonas sp.]|uniref:hypothetical protein n=1 Tax=Sphingomonas sp. TaxID=28214 RepID=UPI001EC71F10|nr:hypothetical protein [Sphingomonas sp.]MBX3593000.1 hypothetical protein [Sphingomonas sp.]